MKVLIIDEWLPWPLESGKKIRSFQLAAKLSEHHEIIYMGYANLRDEKEKIEVLEKCGIRPIPVPDNRCGKWTPRFYLKVALNLFSNEPFSSEYHIQEGYISLLRETVRKENPDLIHCEWTNLAPFLAYTGDIPAVITAHNVESLIWERYARNTKNPLIRLVASRQASRLEKLEREWYPRVSHCIAVSEEDRRIIESYGARVSVVENGVDVQYYEIEGKDRAVDEDSVIFVASFDTFANQDAVKYFVCDIFPLLQKEKPTLRFLAVGKDPPTWMKNISRKHGNIVVTGTVPDVRPYLSSAAVYVVPLRIGGGSRLKILEAMAMGMAVVSTTIGAEGLCVKEGENILLADRPEQIASEILNLMNDPTKRERLGKKGLGLVTDRYDWSIIAEKQDKVWINACETAVALKERIIA